MGYIPPAHGSLREWMRIVATTFNSFSADIAGGAVLHSEVQADNGSSLINFIQSGSDTVARTVEEKLRDTVHVKDFGAVGDGVTDDTDAINAALAASTVVMLGKGTFKITDTLVLDQTGHALIGEGQEQTKINVVSTTAIGIAVANGLSGPAIVGLTVYRTGVPTSSAHGIQFSGTTDLALVSDVHVTGHYDGLIISTTDVSLLRRVRASKNLSEGIYQTNVVVYGASQWEFQDILVDQNGRDGIRVESVAGPAGLILGSWNSVKTFANSGRGIHLVGNSTTGIYDLRLVNAFVGSDQLCGLRIDSYGGKHRVSGFFERIGRDATGPTLGTAAGDAGEGIDVTANNSDVVVYGSTINENSDDGILHNGGKLIVSGSMIYDNGQGLTAGRRNGILSNAGSITVGSSTSTNIGGATQLYGIATAHASYVVTGNDLSGNTTADSFHSIGGGVSANNLT